MSGTDQTNPDQEKDRGENKTQEAKPLGRMKRFFCCLGCLSSHPNSPQYVIALFTGFLAWFALEAWNEAQQGTIALRGQIKAQTQAIDLTTRAILTSDLKKWKISPSPLAASASPVVAFDIKNDGHQYAHIFGATYETEFTAKAPVKFGSVKRIPDFPALLGPGINYPIIIGGLPSIAADQLPLLDSGQIFLWIRTIFEYRDDQAIVFQVRFTGRYGRGIDEKGAPDFGFSFPDKEVRQDRWSSFGHDGSRCLNIDKSEPQDLGCGYPQ